MTFLQLDTTQIQETAALIKTSVDMNHQLFYNLSKSQQSLSNWQGASSVFFLQQFSKINQAFERQNQVILSYHSVLTHYLCQTHLATEAVNLRLAEQIK
ncbi:MULTISPECIES: hypothetical protein [unclassified Enterococcus]|uniref:hypothetical protein n=1 Tax=unclassified Enterococcus TaxID=2608891 RepID=UPI00155258D9|nr:MULTISPECIES: hypothetical protein [unclassified Enterococcus]MBS7576550.1 hypothetical protein [Enterococcus sp. MMGLQ5-2]MBS7583963.1 hypothetical protein [Enterococcus sp. MMGLQ5-1]NPD11824.1 hypothetical protein [Enterococcus sp. MMGLQ5-1]NPD36387.1 hypothetical protein [Enterococcus sp. MMGLQ5-2]